MHTCRAESSHPFKISDFAVVKVNVRLFLAAPTGDMWRTWFQSRPGVPDDETRGHPRLHAVRGRRFVGPSTGHRRA